MPFQYNAAPISETTLQITAAFNLATTAAVLIPAGRRLLGFYCTDADFAHVDPHISHDGGTNWVECVFPTADDFAGIVNLFLLFARSFPKSDGQNIRLYNSGGNPCDGIQYVYSEDV